MRTKQLIVFVGIQASGKSTFFREVLAKYGYHHINLDTLKTRQKESREIEVCLESGVSFVVDNTNPEKADRERYILPAKREGYEVIGIFFKSVLKDCVHRNEVRQQENEAKGVNIKPVPSYAISSTQKRLQLPEYEEGFDKLFFAEITKNGFNLTNWKG